MTVIGPVVAPTGTTACMILSAVTQQLELHTAQGLAVGLFRSNVTFVTPVNPDPFIVTYSPGAA